MIDPIDLIGGLGSAAFSGVAKLLAKPVSASMNGVVTKTGLTGYLKEAQSMMGVNLDVTKYTKELMGNPKLMDAVIAKGKLIYGKDLSLPQMVTRSGPVTMKNIVEDLARQGYAGGGYVTQSGLSISGASEEDLEKFKYGRAGRLKGVARVVNGLEISGENQEEIDRFIYGRAGKPSATLPTITSATGLEIQTASIDNFKKLVNQGDTISFPKSNTSLNLNDSLSKISTASESYGIVSTTPLSAFGTEHLGNFTSGANNASLSDRSALPIYGETNNTPIVSKGIDLGKVSEQFKVAQSTEKIMVERKPLIQQSEGELQDKIGELAKLRDLNTTSAKNLISGIEQIKFSHATTPEEVENKKAILAKLEENLAMRRANMEYYEGSLDKPTTTLTAKQFDATSVGYSVNKPTNRWSDLKGPVIMNLSGKGPAFISDDLNKGPDALTDLQKQLAVVGEDTPERRAYLAKLSEDKQKAFMHSLSIASRNAQTLAESGGLKSVYTNQKANFMMAEAVQHYQKSLGGFYFEKSQADAKKLLDTKYGEGTYDKRKARKAVDWRRYNSMYSSMESRAQGDSTFYKRYYDGLPTAPVLPPEVIELIRQLKKDKGEVLTRNNDNPQKHFQGGEVNNLSRQVKHNGGVAHKSGSYFLEGGEVVIPKGFANGGNVIPESLVSRQTKNDQSIEIEGLDTFDKIVRTLEKSLDKLTNIKIEGIDKLTDIKIEGLNDLKDIKIEGLNDLKNIKIEGLSELRDIRIEGLSDLKNVQIEGLENLKNIQIEGLDKLSNIKVEGIDQLHDIKISGLENLRDIKILGVEELKDISIKNSSVGADSGDALASTLKDFDSRVLNLEKNSSNQISLIKSTVDEAISNIPTMDITQRSEIAEIKKDLMTTSSEVSNLTSSMKRFTQEVSVTLKELNDKQNTAMTHIYSIKRQ